LRELLDELLGELPALITPWLDLWGRAPRERWSRGKEEKKGWDEEGREWNKTKKDGTFLLTQ